jgi:hypothetical protein
MTEDKTTITSNEEIARFMGRYITNGWVSAPNGSGQFRVELLKYHDDWRELMPVVAKITKTTPMNQAWYDVKTFLLDGDINVVYRRVLEFIRWYNSTQNKEQS